MCVCVQKKTASRVDSRGAVKRSLTRGSKFLCDNASDQFANYRSGTDVYANNFLFVEARACRTQNARTRREIDIICLVVVKETRMRGKKKKKTWRESI